MNELTEKAKELEAFETPRWCAEAILAIEAIHGMVIDPCCGKGVLPTIAREYGSVALSSDVYDWGYKYQDTTENFLSVSYSKNLTNNTVLMNPPFSKATDFVIACHQRNAQKIICFQRFAWWESKGRRNFWEHYPPNRVYICGNRASCWRMDIPEEERTSSTTTAHAWFVWEQGHPKGTQLGHIWK